MTMLTTDRKAKRILAIKRESSGARVTDRAL